MEFVCIHLDKSSQRRAIFKIVLLAVIIPSMLWHFADLALCVSGRRVGQRAVVNGFRLPQSIRLQIDHKMGQFSLFIS